MALYILDTDPKKTAEYLDDKSLDKMIKDIAQVLCTVYHAEWSKYMPTAKCWNPEILLKPELKLLCKNKPIDEWTHWARECKANYLYLVELGYVLCAEKLERFRIMSSKYFSVIEWARDNVPDFGDYSGFGRVERKADMLPFPLVMPKKYQDIYAKQYARWNSGLGLHKPISLYRNYYQSKLTQKYDVLGYDASAIGYLLTLGKLETTIKICKEVWWTRRNKPEWLHF